VRALFQFANGTGIESADILCQYGTSPTLEEGVAPATTTGQFILPGYANITTSTGTISLQCYNSEKALLANPSLSSAILQVIKVGSLN
jgi:hypothetical protein